MISIAEKKSQQGQNKSLIRSANEEIFNEHNLSSIEKYFGKGSIEGSPQTGKGGEGFNRFLTDFL